MLTLPRGIGALALLKALDPLLRGPQDLPLALWAPALAVWVLGGAALLVAQRGWLLLLAGGLGLAADLPLELRRQHLVLLLLVALAGAVARDDGELLLLVRVQLTALYGVAALAKLNAGFLGGDALAGALAVRPPLPVLLLLGLLVVVGEALLALAPWVPRLRTAALLLAAALHGGALLLLAGGPLVTLRLAVFGGAAVLLVAVSAGRVPVGAPRTALAAV